MYSPSYTNHIAGEDAAPRAGRTFDSINPTTGSRWGTFAHSDQGDVDEAVAAANRAFKCGAWSGLSATERGRLLLRWGESIAAKAVDIGTIETGQNGKLLAETRAQVSAARDWLAYYGGLADKVEGAVIPLARQSVLNYTLREPLGVVAIITPWNSPTFLTAMSAAPALAAGNTIVIKPSEITAASAIEIARLAEASGIPKGVVNVVTGFREVGEALVEHESVAKIAFTGSGTAGRAIASKAGARLIGCTLELGGKSPNIVFADADLDLAEAGVVGGIFAAAGQSCIAGSRAYIHESVYEEFVARLVRRAKGLIIGNPLLSQTQMGPIATRAQLEKDEAMVRMALAAGAELLCGGDRIRVEEYPSGYFFAPTILHKIASGNPILTQEVFGPVLAIVPFRDDDEVVRLANDSQFGLGAGVWTRDVRRAHGMAHRLQAGTVWINTYRAIGFNSPFGGYKSSGLGRQNGIESIYQYLQTKSVWCELSMDVQDPFVLRT